MIIMLIVETIEINKTTTKITMFKTLKILYRSLSKHRGRAGSSQTTQPQASSPDLEQKGKTSSI